MLTKSTEESVSHIDLEPNESVISPCLKSYITFLSTLEQNLILWSTYWKFQLEDCCITLILNQMNLPHHPASKNCTICPSTLTWFDNLTSMLMKSTGESVCHIDLETNESATSPCLKIFITFLSTLGQNMILWSYYWWFQLKDCCITLILNQMNLPHHLALKNCTIFPST